ncbi:class I SAM-dependent methyltransferase [Methanocaldococcus sp.]
MEDVKESIKKYWDMRSISYDKSPGHVGLPNTWKKVLKEVFGNKKLKILDVGTGTGFIAILLAELGHEVVGIDLSERMLEVAKKKAENRGVTIEFMIGDAENLPFCNEEFDAVINRHLLWTLPNPHKAVSEWVRVTRHGGKVVIIDGKWRGEGIDEIFSNIMRWLAILIHEKKAPWKHKVHYDNEINNKLPFYGGSDPENVVELLNLAGINKVKVKDLKWIKEELFKTLPFLYRLAWKNKSYFLVEGHKI